MKSGNHTAAPQWLYLVIKPELAIPAFAFLLLQGFSWPVAGIVAGLLMPFKIGITGNLSRRFRTIKRTSPGIEIPVPIIWLPGAYYVEQFLHLLFWPFRVRWIGTGKTEWFVAGLGVAGIVLYGIINVI